MTTLFSSLRGALQGRQPIRRDLHILRRYVLNRRNRTPFLASYKLTYRCNLRCLQCPFYRLETPEPTFSQVIDTLDRLKSVGVGVLILEGGEPALWRDGQYTVADVIAEARQRFFCVGMTTNGTQGLNLPTDVLWVSIDGFAETHNRLRGAAVFEKIMANIEASSHPRLYAHITINRQNAAEVPDLLKFLSARVDGVTVQFYYPYDGADELYLGQPERGQLIDALLTIKSQGLPLLNSGAALLATNSGGWQCDDWLIANADPDGEVRQGCYLKGRGDIDCTRCGFTPHTEISLAYQGRLEAIQAGIRIFFGQ
jgi:MoaA/NifB/PqqE/SkfB family radical SAM enzyme